jgi:hypothetical protein
MNQTEDLPPLAEFVDLRDLLPQVLHTFPTLDSVRWFVRIHREPLARAGAVIAITGRLRFHPDRFQQAATEIGRASIVK